MTREARQIRCPEAVLGWIPWYSEGGLTEQQMGIVEAHAAECAECRTELDMVSGAPFEVDFELPDPGRMFEEITQRIEERADAGGSVIPIDRARVLSVDDLETIESWVLDPHADDHAEDEEARSLEEQEGFTAGLFPEFANGQTPTPVDVRPASFKRESGHEATLVSRPVSRQVSGQVSKEDNVVEGPWARKAIWAAAAALALFLMGGLGGSLLSTSLQATSLQGETAPGRYALASARPDTSLAGVVAPQIDVVFLDSVSALDISNTLRADGLEIVSGPSGLGVYRLALTPTAVEGRVPSAADAAEIAARLSAPGSPIAMFAEPVP